MDEPALILLRARDPDTLRSVVTEHGRRLYRAARGMGLSSTVAEDVVQDVFVTFLETLDRFEGRAQVGTWLFGILHLKALERRRSLARDDLNEPIDTVFEAQFDERGNWAWRPVGPDRAFDARESAAAIAGCLDALTGQRRDVFHFRQVEELSAAEVSKITGLSVTHIGVVLHRARTALRACLEAKGWGRSR